MSERLRGCWEVELSSVGQKVGPFELVERLGAANGTTLFRATRANGPREPEVVAIRVADRVDDPLGADVVRREYEILRSLADDRIPEVLGYYPGQAALAVQWAGGISLADAIASARSGWTEIEPATALDICVDIAVALRSAHGVVRGGQPVVHGHLGPQRVRLDEHGDVWVVGFGLDAVGRHPAWLSPEQAARAAIEPRTDQWAVGAMLAEMLLGRRLYEGEYDPAIAALEGRVQAVTAEIERRWPPIGRVARKLLGLTPGERYTSDGEVVAGLLTASREVGGVANRTSLVASVLRQRELAARASEPMMAPAFSLSVKPVLGDDTGTEAIYPEDRTAPGNRRDDDDDEAPDAFPDTPTSPDGLALLKGVLFPDDSTSNGMVRADEDTDPLVLQQTDEGHAEPLTDPALPEPASVAPPTPAPASSRPRLQGWEIVAAVLILVLFSVGIFFLFQRS